MSLSKHYKLIKYSFLGFILCLGWLTGCISVKQPVAGQKPDTGQNETLLQKTQNQPANNPYLDQIESELLRVYAFKDKALISVNHISDQVTQTIARIESCKGPVNRLEPFMFTNTTIAPADQLYLRSSINPCGHYPRDTEIASQNAFNHLEYIEQIESEVVAAGRQVEQSCRDNGMSDQYKSLVHNTLVGFREMAQTEIIKFDIYIREILEFLAGYQACIRESGESGNP